MKRKPKKKAEPSPRYYTHEHNIDMCLANGSFVRQYADGKLVQYMNGDCMGPIAKIPDGMVEVPADHASDLIPGCCRLAAK